MPKRVPEIQMRPLTLLGLALPALLAACGCSLTAKKVATPAAQLTGEDLAQIPKPPASETAAANGGVEIGPPSEAAWIGIRQPTRSMKLVGGAMCRL